MFRFAGVFYCGSALLVKTLRELCQEFTLDSSTRFQFHKENFWISNSILLATWFCVEHYCPVFTEGKLALENVWTAQKGMQVWNKIIIIIIIIIYPGNNVVNSASILYSKCSWIIACQHYPTTLHMLVGLIITSN
jgi:hypothetical protein